MQRLTRASAPLVFSFRSLDASKWENDPALEKICKERGYNYRDFVNSTKMPGLKEKLDTFLIE
jgi:hypothetical protein